MEWTESYFGGSYPFDRVLRGGSWSNDPSNMRSWSRFNNTFYTQDGGNNIGFRCVKDI
jgi:formylglycine-generating enzyme required for sulfatase activity